MTSTVPVVLITGAGGEGIGSNTAVRFAKAGYIVAATDICPLDATVKAVEATGARCLPLYLDVCKRESVEQAVKSVMDQCGRINVLVNNAAASLGTDIMQIEEERWDANITLALKSVYLVTRTCLPHLLAAGHGSAIVNISSVNGQTGLGEEAYAAAKAGVINLTQNLAVRYGPQGLRCNCVSPGTIETQLWRERLKQDPQTFEKLKKYYPLARLGTGEDVANAVYFLSSAQSSWITGTTLNVDGGLMAGNSQLQRDLVPQGDL